MKGNNVLFSDLNLKLRSILGAQFPDCANGGAAEEDDPYSILSPSDLLGYYAQSHGPVTDKGDLEVYSGRIGQRNSIVSRYCTVPLSLAAECGDTAVTRGWRKDDSLRLPREHHRLRRRLRVV